MWVDNQGIRTKFFDKEILFEFANLVENITLCDQEINLVRIDDPPKILGTQFIHKLIINDILSIPLCKKTSQSLFGANGKRLAIKYKLTDVHIHNHDICIKQTFILVKDLNEKRNTLLKLYLSLVGR